MDLLPDITPAQAVELVQAVGSLWATAWVFRQLRKIVR